MGLYDDLLNIQQDKASTTQTIPGVVTAVVKENYNSAHQGMIKVEFIMGETGKKMSEWVRVMAPYAGKTYGQYWLPEVGSEVLIAFIFGDPNWPIALGGLWNQVDQIPKKAADEKNQKKIIRTKGGNEILFDDTTAKEKITITTPKGLKIEVDDQTQKISLMDKEKKVNITMDGKKGKLTLDAQKGVDIKVSGKNMISINSQAIKLTSNAITIDAKQSLKMKGQSTEVSGSTTRVKSTGPLTLSSSAIAQLKGTIVKIN
ncbi:MAG: phage baseplate assembly protein V [Lachnospiraceae bacterium]